MLLGPGAPPCAHFQGNAITTSKYNILTFLPIFLFVMFSRVAYLYFLLQARFLLIFKFKSQHLRYLTSRARAWMHRCYGQGAVRKMQNVIEYISKPVGGLLPRKCASEDCTADPKLRR